MVTDAWGHGRIDLHQDVQPDKLLPAGRLMIIAALEKPAVIAGILRRLACTPSRFGLRALQSRVYGSVLVPIQD